MPDQSKSIVDVHAHLGQFARSDMSADGDRLRELYREAGVTHGVAFSIEACYGGIDAGNASVLAEVANHDMLSAMVVAHPHHFEASRRWVSEGASNPDVVGVKLHPALGQYDVLTHELARLIEEVIAPSGLTVLSHVGNDSLNVPIKKYLELAARFPDTRFIAAHLGVGMRGLRDSAIDAWKKKPLANVWFDMGTLRAFHTGAVESLLKAVGPERICFGTDTPLYTPAPFVRLLETLAVTEEVRERIAFRNAQDVLPKLAGKPGTGV